MCGRDAVARTQTLLRPHIRRRAKYAPSHAVPCTVSQASGQMHRCYQNRMHSGLRGRPPAAHSRGQNRALLRVHRRKSCRTRGLARERSRGDTRSGAPSTRPCTRFIQTCGHIRRRTPCDAAGHGQRTRPEMCTRRRDRCRECCPATPSGPYVRRRAQHAPLHAMSLERADSCIVALTVERTAHADGHRQCTRP